MELYPILYLLRLQATASSIPISQLKIVDLMSGSGFLAENLYKVGYHNLHAIEFCEAMCQDAQIYANQVRLHRIASFAHLEGYLEEINPDVIVSLASFHHLLCCNDENGVDLHASISLQKNVVDICMRSLSGSGLLVIADLIEENVRETMFPDSDHIMSRVLQDLMSLGMPREILDNIKKCRSIQGASSIISRALCCRTDNMSLKWFRNVVDVKTSIGHKDIAISETLLEKLKVYDPCIAKYRCPWIFNNKEEQSSFLYHKFGFALDSGTSGAVLPTDVSAMAEKELGVKNLHGKSLLGWNLGVIAIWKTSPFESARCFRYLVLCLLLLIGLLSVALFSRLLFELYVKPSWGGALIFTMTFLLGMIFGEIIQSMSRKPK